VAPGSLCDRRLDRADVGSSFPLGILGGRYAVSGAAHDRVRHEMRLVLAEVEPIFLC
jgi:hypothetical protein